MNIVIAGISGFLGSRVKYYFEKKNYKVFNYKKNLPNKIDAIINLAGPNNEVCDKYPIKSIKDRLSINKKIVEIIRKKKIKKFFYISTIHVYKKQKILNESSKLNYKNAYAKSHLISEEYLSDKLYNTCEYKILRLANCFGYCKNVKSNSWNLVKNIFLKKKIIIKSKINFKRDFIPVNYFLYNLEKLIKKKTIKYKIINISSQKSKSILDISKDIKNLFKNIYKKNLKIQKNFKYNENASIIKSRLMNKKNNVKLQKLYFKELKELIIFSKNRFEKK